jgi:hypothetical protein
VHVRYHGWSHQNCPLKPRKNGFCQLFSLSAAHSIDGGRTFKHVRPPPHHLVATPPYKYDGSHLWYVLYLKPAFVTVEEFDRELFE